MNANIAKAFIVLAGMVFLQGCAQKSMSVSEGTGAVDTADLTPQTPSHQEGWLQTCLFEASQLNDMSGGKYAEKKELLYQTVREAKYYASVSSRVSADTAMVMTPYYQYKMYDICKELSRDMYNELKAGTFPGKTK